MNHYIYIFLCLGFINSCEHKSNFKIDRHLILLAYIELEKKEISDIYQGKIDKLIKNNSITNKISNNIYVTRLAYGGETSDPSFWKYIFYIYDLKTNFKFAFGSVDEMCYHNIRVDCNHPLFNSRYLVCRGDSRLRLNLNYILNELNISDLEAAKEIVRGFMDMRIDSIHQLQLQITRKYVTESFKHLDSIRNCCLDALETIETNFSKIQQSKNTDLFESQFRGVWSINYIEANGTVQIEDEYLLMECMKVHPIGFSNFIEARQTDSLLKEYERKMK